ncbi:alkylation response protein AidB-like acyl-CoA dehydrogenase [Variovorax boronicumulans]|uniref:acyl-CoA dehydrogenase family protein n=1 Tax=Variovorax boronicumulans TaxID=436515 RepID=UPI0027862811|nr:acyl-CoA dehydrogenase family protein [Variovorax boronicumulans]MDQ0035744.1 alkylation response protein AidB-like acyl-CoA dehydrogenase [Variovorax boronicumulans]MDQ0040493.1 alkylation response protein AidB-like acyl-CoA dehydrogenase [Variovorax boronicumulans]
MAFTQDTPRTARANAAPAAPSSQQLLARFRPIFNRIAVHAAQRENDRELAHEPVAWLNAERFGALRVPAEYGGIGASVEQLYDLLIELGEADSNLPQILRAHFGFIERLFAEIDPSLHGPWMRLAAEGVIFGNATTELGEGALGALQTTLSRAGDAWRLDGDKYYSTGTLYADWISVSAQRLNADGSSDRVIALVPSEAEGVERVDDWRGFGQRLSASGTTRFRNVRVNPENVLLYVRDQPTPLTAHFQLTHLATLAGIARAIVRDAVAFVQPRKRVYSHGSGDTPREDPLVQQVIGQLASTAFIAASTVQAVARGLGEVDRFRQRGEPVPESLLFEVELNTAKAQAGIVDAVLLAGTRLFDIGGASALQEDRRLDRHWRNARTLASHNPTIYKGRVVGDHLLNGARPTFYWAVGAIAA